MDDTSTADIRTADIGTDDTGTGTDGDALHTRLDRLTDLVDERLRRIDEQLRGLDRDTGEIIGLLITLAAVRDRTVAAIAEPCSDPENEESPEPAGPPSHRLN